MVAQLAARHPGVDGLGHLLLEGDAYVSIAVGLQPAGDFLDRGSATDAARSFAAITVLEQPHSAT